MAPQQLVGLGASLAAAKVAQTLREENFAGRLVVIHSGAPVDRHRLSDPAVPLRDSSECTSIRR
jgi:hypothetical protein